MAWSLWYDYLIVPVCFPLLLPLAVGSTLVFAFSQDRFARLSAFFVLKPVVTYPVWIVLFMLSNGEHSLFLATIRIIPALIVTGVLIYNFREQFDAINVRAWFLVLIDIIRWGNTYLLDINPEYYPFRVEVGLFIPSAYAMLVLVFIDRKNVHQNNID